MRTILRWFLMLSKRLYKKATFLAILALIPICALTLAFVAKEDSGFLHIVLVQTNPQDDISAEITQKLLQDESVIRFTEVSTPAKAVDMVKTGEADCAWVFSDDMQEKITDYEGAIHVVFREQTVFLRLTHEKLFSVMYEYCARARMIEYARTEVKELDHLSDEELLQYFDNVGINEDLFVVGEKGEAGKQNADTSYLLFPLRGLLGILIVLCGMAAMMYYIQDEQNGMFAWVPEGNRICVSISCLAIAMLHVATVVLFSLYMTGVASDFGKEIASLILFLACCVGFCLVLKRVFASLRMYGAVIPLFTVIMIAICPVFFDFRQMRLLQYVFPPTYYVNAIYEEKYYLYMILYSLICGGIYWGLGKIKVRK